MIKRLKKTCTLIVLTTTLAATFPKDEIQATAAIESNSEYKFEILKNKTSLASIKTLQDEEIEKMIEAYLNKKNPDSNVLVDSPKYIEIKISDKTAQMLTDQICSSNSNIRKLLKNEPDMVKPGASKEEAAQIVDNMTDEQIEAIKPKVKEVVYKTIKAFDGQSVPVYGYKIVKDGKVVDMGFFVGGQIGLLIMQKEGAPLIISSDSISDINDKIKNEILEKIQQKLKDIINKSGISEIINKVIGKVDDVVSDITDTIDDLADAVDDLSDSIKDKADDIDDAWDKVFDRFDNDEGWGKRDGYIYYYDEDGISLKGVQKIDGKTYYFNRIDGAMETGWQIVDGHRCYFDEKKGYQLFLQWVKDGDDWYFLSNEGPVKKSEWVNDQGKKYYLKSDGKMAKNWLKIDDYWYYFNDSNGVMEHSTWKYSDEKWYYLKEDGKAANDWTYINDNWYYFREKSASMETGWFRADGSWYFADSSGAMKTGWLWSEDGWYYLDDTTGKMKKNEWLYKDGNWYYFNLNGIMASKSRYIDGVKYNFNSDGRLN
ncbi:MAG: N-acetylmuramoyl-L-alanine amidase family protein [Clostridium sp.]